MVGIVSKKSVTFIGQKLAAQIDEQLFSKYGFKVEQLMELAGLAAAQAIAAHYPKSKKGFGKEKRGENGRGRMISGCF